MYMYIYIYIYCSHITFIEHPHGTCETAAAGGESERGQFDSAGVNRAPEAVTIVVSDRDYRGEETCQRMGQGELQTSPGARSLDNTQTSRLARMGQHQIVSSTIPRALERLRGLACGT